MSQPIPLTTSNKPRTLSMNQPTNLHDLHIHNSQLHTPNGTPPSALPLPPHHVESRLQQLLAHFESGTHSFCREERESVEERRMSHGGTYGMGAGDVWPTPPSSRRPSFLSSLSLSRPFGFTPTTSTPPSSVGTPISGSHPKESFAHAQSNAQSHAHGHMPTVPASPTRSDTDMSMTSPHSRPSIEPYGPTQTQSSPNVLTYNRAQTHAHAQGHTQPHWLDRNIDEGYLSALSASPKSSVHAHANEANPAPIAPNMGRAKTAPAIPVKQNGFVASSLAKGGLGHGSGNGGGGGFVVEEKRHFDPGREPKLLGLL